MHNGFLQVESEKMSKSLGNFVTIRDLVSEYPGSAVRLNMLKTHYRQPLDWTNDSLLATMVELGEWTDVLNLHLGDEFVKKGYGGAVDEKVVEALADDLNSPLAIARLREMFRSGTRTRNPNDLSNFARTLEFLGIQNLDKPGYFNPGFSGHLFESGPSATKEIEDLTLRFRAATANGWVSVADSLYNDISSRGFVLKLTPAGLVELRNTTSADFEARIDDQIRRRAEARAARDWKESDRIRDELAALGVVLKDNKDGTTTWEIKR
jgi:cysteinyl-tRNA synthetase